MWILGGLWRSIGKCQLAEGGDANSMTGLAEVFVR